MVHGKGEGKSLWSGPEIIVMIALGREKVFLGSTWWAKKVIPLVQCNVMYERYHIFWPTLYITEACPLRNSQHNSINYVISSTCRKIFNTRSQEVVDTCLDMFNCLPAEKAIAIRKKTF